jgi:hypothetical protein
MDQWWHLQREGDLRSTFEKADSATVVAHHHVHHFMDKNKLTLLSQCKLKFTGRNVLMALKIQPVRPYLDFLTFSFLYLVVTLALTN